MKCQNCGGVRAYIKQTYKGTCNWKFNLETLEEEGNEDMYEGTTYKTQKFYYCENCNVKLGRIEDIDFGNSDISNSFSN